MMNNKNQYKLYNYFPAFLAIVFTPFGFIPLFGNLIANAIVIMILLIIGKQLKPGHLIKNTLLSYAVAMAGLTIGLIICMKGQAAPFDFQNASIEEISEFAKVYKEEDAMMQSTIIMYVGFFISTIAIFIGHLFITFGKRTRGILYRKTWQRFVFSAVLTVLNAPYLLFISNDFLESLGYNIFLPTMM